MPRPGSSKAAPERWASKCGRAEAMAKLSKRQKALTPVDREKFYGGDEAISVVKSNATAKFDETIAPALTLGAAPRHADQTVRAVVNLPRAPARMSGSR